MHSKFSVGKINNSLLHIYHVQIRTGLSERKINALVRAGLFPKKYWDDFGPCFVRSEVEAWIDNQISIDQAKVQTRAYTHILSKALFNRDDAVPICAATFYLKPNILQASGFLQTLSRDDVSHLLERLLEGLRQAVSEPSAELRLAKPLCFPVLSQDHRGSWVIRLIFDIPTSIDASEFVNVFAKLWQETIWSTDRWFIDVIEGCNDALTWISEDLADISLNDNTVDSRNLNIQ